MNKAEFEERASSATLIELLSKNTKSNRKILFVNGTNEAAELTYGDLYREAAAIGNSLGRYVGNNNNREVVLQIRDPHRFLMAFWACLFRGFLPIPLSVAEDDESTFKLLEVLRTLSHHTVIYDVLNLGKLKDSAVKLGFGDLADRIQPIAVDELINTKTADSNELVSGLIAFIQYSSGSSGLPKGVSLSHKNLIANTADIFVRSNMTDESRLLNWMPLTHDMGLIGFHLTAVFGNLDQFILPTELYIKRPLTWLDSINKYRVTHSYSPNFGYRYLLASISEKFNYNWDLSCLQLMYNGAEPISNSLCDQFEMTLAKYKLPRHVITPAYGLAEASVSVTLHKGDKRLEYLLDRASLRIGQRVQFAQIGMGVVSTGKTMDSCHLRITNEHDIELPDQYLGHIQIKGRNVTSGYHNNAEATKKLFTEDGWLKTGDLGFINAGNLVVTGRFKNLIIINGQNYYPADLEKFIYELPGIEMGKVAIVSSVIDEEEKLIVFLSVKIPSSKKAEMNKLIRSTILERINLYVYDVVYVKKMPKTTSGKIQYYKLREEYRNTHRDRRANISARETNLESLIMDLQPFFKTAINPDECFANLGLSSINALQVIFALNKKYGTDLVLGDLFDHDTVNKLFLRINNTPLSKTEIWRMPDSLHYDTSISQQRLWILSKLNRQDRSTLGLSFYIRGMADELVIANAWKEIVHRHEILRTSFAELDGLLVQRVNTGNDHEIYLQQFDFSNGHDPQDMVAEFCARIFDHPISLTDKVILKIFILKLAADSFCCVLYCHHIIMDGWSVSVLKDELTRLLVGEPLEEILFHYKDFAHWHNAVLLSDKFENQKSYWKKKYGNGFPAFTFPVLKAINASTSPNSGSIFVRLSDKSIQQLSKFCEASGATLFTGLCSLVGILLSRYTIDGRAFFGVPSSGRLLEQLERQVGYYLNILPVEIAIDETKSFRELLSETKKELISTYKNQDYPIESIIALNKTSSRVALSVFDVLVLLENFNALLGSRINSENSDSAISITVDEIENRSLPSNLYFEFKNVGNGLSLRIKYNTDLYFDKQIDELLQNFVRLLDVCIKSPDHPVRTFTPLEVNIEKPTQNLDNVFGTELTFLDLFANQVKKKPHHTAVLARQQSLSYTQLDFQSRVLASVLAAHSIKKNDMVVLYLERTEWMVISVLAVWKMEAVIIPVDSSTPAYRVEEIISDSSASIIVTDVHSNHDFKIRTINPATGSLVPNPIESIPGDDRNVSHDNPAYAIYTSGSTGKSKAVLVSHKQLMSVTNSWTKCYSLEKMDPKILQIASFGFDVFIGDLSRAISAGGTLIICPAESRGLPEEMYRLLESHQVNIFESTPAIVIPLLDYIAVENKKIDFIKIVIVGSDKWLLSDYGKYRKWLSPAIRLVNSYGTTETTIDSTFFEADSVVDMPAAYVPIGKPLSNTTCYILDRYLRPVPLGVQGNLFIGGQGVSNGYLNDPTLTSKQFIKKPDAQEKLYNTGDLVRMLSDGNIEFLERCDTQIKILGNRVEPKEIERIIAEFDNVKSVFVALKTIGTEDHLCAYIVAMSPLDISECRAFLMTRVPRFMVPNYFIFVNELPLTLNGKINANALPVPIIERKIIQQGAFSELEMVVFEIWSEILKIGEFDRDADFFELGGQSLKAVQILFKVNKRFGTQITLSGFFSNSKFSDFCKLIKPSERRLSQPVQSTTFPLSSNQRSVYLHSKVSGLNSLYNLPRVFEVTGALDIAKLEKAVNMLVSQHEILRTVFLTSQDGLRQQVLESFNPIKLHCIDVKEGQNFNDLITELTRVEFNFSLFPLFGITLLRDENRTCITFVTNHIISDALSSDIIFQELQGLYEKGDKYYLEPLKFQYSNFVFKQAEMQIAYPQNEDFLRAISAKFVPLNLAHSPVPTHRGNYEASHHVFLVSDELIDGMQKVCVDEHVTPFVFWSTAVAALIHFYQRQSHISLAYPLTERDLVSDENMIGFFSNMQVMPLKICKNDTFIDLLGEVKRCYHDNFQTRFFSYDQLAERLAEYIHVPPIEVSIVLNETDADLTLNFGSSQFSPLDVHTPFAKYNLTFVINRMCNNWHVDIEYKNHFFSEELIAEFEAKFLTLVKAITTKAESEIEKTSLINSTDRLSYARLNDTGMPSLVGHSATKLLSENFKKYSKKSALRFNDVFISYNELDLRSTVLASYLKNGIGVEKGDIVALCMNRSEYLVVLILAIMKCGAAFVPVDPATPEERIDFILSDSKTNLLVSDRAMNLDFKKVVLTTELLRDAINFNFVDNLPDTAPEDVLYILYTSGSTGVPKGVEITSQSLANYLLWFNHYYLNNSSGFMTCLFTSIGFDLTMSSLFSPLLRGDLLVIFPEENPIKSLQRIFGGEYEVNTIKLTPSHIKLIHNIGIVNEAIKKVIVGGETFTENAAMVLRQNAPNCDIYNEYGPTETTIGSTVMKVTSSAQAIFIGFPIANTHVYIVSSERFLLPPEAEGEIAIGGLGLATGYRLNSGLTENKFFMSSELQERLYLTGDRGKLGIDGVIRFYGRIDDQMKVNGFRIEPEEIQKVLLATSFVKDAIITIREIQGDSFLIAYLIVTGHVTVEELRNALSRKLPTWMIPAHFIIVSSFPLSVNGKIKINELPIGPEYFMTDETFNDGILTELETKLLKFWRDVLKNIEIDIKSNFFSHGGNSFKAVQLLQILEREFPAVIDITDIYDYPSVSMMAQYVEKKTNFDHNRDSVNEFLV